MTNIKIVYKKILYVIALFCFSCSGPSTTPEPKLKALILDGQSNHYVWPKSTLMMRDYLIQTHLFNVDVKRTANIWPGIKYGGDTDQASIDEIIDNYLSEDSSIIVDTPRTDPNFNPDFSSYDLVILNFGLMAAPWPETTKKSFQKYIYNGGGLVLIHAVNNAWPEWPEFNQMAGIGGWGGRDTTKGRYIYYDTEGNLQLDSSPGICGSHGKNNEFKIQVREPNHPINQGLPEEWMHSEDELYARLRGPAKNVTVLATAFSDKEKEYASWDGSYGSNRHEPMLMTINYGKGRIFHSLLGHFDYSLECVGFITTFQRGAEWAATGSVTQEVPKDFPSKNKIRKRKYD